MARSKAKSQKTREENDNSNNNSTGEMSRRNAGNRYPRLCPNSVNSQHPQHPYKTVHLAMSIRQEESSRPMSAEEVKASKYRHLNPYDPPTTPPTLVTHERGRVRMEFPRKRNGPSNGNPYDRWTESKHAVDEVIDLDTPPPSVGLKPKVGRRGRKAGSGKGAAGLTPTSGTHGRLSYTLLGIAKENPLDRPRQMIYGVAFNNWVGETVDIFATVGDATVTVYRVRPSLYLFSLLMEIITPPLYI